MIVWEPTILFDRISLRMDDEVRSRLILKLVKHKEWVCLEISFSGNDTCFSKHEKIYQEGHL